MEEQNYFYVVKNTFGTLEFYNGILTDLEKFIGLPNSLSTFSTYSRSYLELDKFRED
jgi:hypothetical protein